MRRAICTKFCTVIEVVRAIIFYGPLLTAKFDLDRCNVSPLRGENPQNLPMSKRNTGRAALRADPAGNDDE